MTSRKIIALDKFMKALMHEKDKLINMGIIKGSNAHALVVHERSNAWNLKTKKQGKGKVSAKPKKEGCSKPFDDSSSSKGGK